MKISINKGRLVLTMMALFLYCGYAMAETAENKLIRLRNQMAVTQNTAEQKQILQEVGTTGTFPAMMFAAGYLDNAALKKVAAKAVVDIATKHIEYNGKNTREVLAKAAKLVGGADKKRAEAYLMIMPQDEEGFVSLFNGKDLTGWKGLVENPIRRAQMSADEMAKAQEKADELMRQDWVVKDGCLSYIGHGGDNLCTVGQYGDFELLVDWKLDPSGKEPDAGIYLRGTPQVQIWDIARVNVGAQCGSGGLYNNQKNPSKPTSVADNKLGEWNTFHIKMVADRVTVIFNGVKVVDNVILENYWDRAQPIFPVEQLELQAHGSKTYFRDIYVKKL